MQRRWAVIEGDFIDRIWPCNCPACKLVKKLLRFLARRWEVEENKYNFEEVVREMSEGERKNTGMGNDEVSQLIQALKEAVMELRETVTELTNPFNRIGTQETPKVESAQTPSRKVEVIPLSNRKEKESEKREADNEVSINGSISSRSKELRRIIEEDKLILAPTISKAKGRNVQKLIRLMKALFSLRGRVPPSILERYIEVFAKLGMISEEDASIAKELLKAIEEGYSKGLSVEDQILLLTLLAKGLGITDESLEEETLGIIANIIGRQHHATPRSSKSGNGPKSHEESVSMDKVG